MCFFGLGSIAGSCLGSCCAGCCCAGLSDCKAKHGPASRIPYIFLMFVSCIFAVVMSLYGQKELYNNDLLNINLQACEDESCQGSGSVYRTSFALFLFFIIHWLIIRWVPSFHWLFLMMKLICFVCFLTASFWIPSDFYDGYSMFARVASIIFLILQLIVLITWAWDVNERLINKIEVLEKEEEPETETKATICCSKTILIGATLGLNIAIIVLWALFFDWFIPNDNCNFNEFVISFTIIIVVIITALSCYFSHASIFTGAVVSFYATYLCYAALSAYPENDCNTFSNSSDTATSKNTGVLWVGLIITAAAISYAGFSVSNNSAGLTGNDNGNAVELEAGKKPQKSTTSNAATTTDDKETNDNAEAVADTSNYDDAVAKDKDEEEHLPIDKLELDKRDNLRFHLCMAFASIYMCMLYTNWGTNTTDTATAQARGEISVWINLSAQWLTAILYLWTVLAPKVCPDRFGMGETE